MKFTHKLVIFLGFLSLFLLAVTGPLYNIEWLSLGVAFTVLRWVAYLAIASFIVNLVLLIYRRPSTTTALLSVLALVAAAVTFYIPYSQYQTAKSVPPIHDISTDLVNPPEFKAIVPLRKDAPNPVAYPGQEVAKQQRQAYPTLDTYTTQQSVSEVFARALEVANSMEWEIIAAKEDEGRIEAVATTAWFGFKDDVVIRIQQVGEETHLDIRSKSRIGRSDVGKNADRIREFLSRM